jgi:tetratricopeptide (TPR) repeat protein
MTPTPDDSEVLRAPSPLSQDLAEYETAAREAVSGGQLLTAIDIARDGLRRFGESPALRQQLALALAQTGALEAALEVLEALRKDSGGDVETLCLIGRVHKDRWRRAATPAEGAAALQQACAAYGEAFAKGEGYYPGINLAHTLAAMGEREKADECARKVAKQCKAEIAKAGDAADGWLLATLAEALTHQGATAEAAKYYAEAVKHFPGRWRDLASMRRQAREIISFNPETRSTANAGWRGLLSFKRAEPEAPGAWLEQCFEFPSVVVFSGHMVDAVGRAVPRFPPAREAEVKARIRAELVRLRAGFGYSSAACGGDLLFCECLLELGAKVNLVLPCPVDAFKRQSVNFAGPEWVSRFHAVLGQAHTCLTANASSYATSDADDASSVALVYANRIVTGLAAMQAQALDVELHALALWDGRPGDGGGGTSSVVAGWERRKLTPHVISIGSGPASAAPVPGRESPAPKTPAVAQEIKAMVFAELANYKKITEAQMPAYVRELRPALAGIIAGSGAAPAAAECWSGTNYFYYDNLADAARFALDLRDFMAGADWAARGLPADLGVRIVLHAGPVFAFADPVLQRPAFIGSHVLRGAQVGPGLPLNQVHVTQEFAALCSEEGIDGLHFAFMGRLPMTRLFEDAPLYRLDRQREISLPPA